MKSKKHIYFFSYFLRWLLAFLRPWPQSLSQSGIFKDARNAALLVYEGSIRGDQEGLAERQESSPTTVINGDHHAQDITRLVIENDLGVELVRLARRSGPLFGRTVVAIHELNQFGIRQSAQLAELGVENFTRLALVHGASL